MKEMDASQIKSQPHASIEHRKILLLPVMTYYKQDADNHEWKSNNSNIIRLLPWRNGCGMIDKIDENTKDKA